MSFLRTMASLINTDNLWSDSLTKDVLTDYAEGLACNNFDTKTIYNTRRHKKYTWYVLKKAAGEEGVQTSKNQQFFDQICMITIHDDYMSCICDNVQRYLMPCYHFCAFIYKREYYEPSMFHAQWHKFYSYYHGTKYGASNTKETVDVLQSLLKVTR